MTAMRTLVCELGITNRASMLILNKIARVFPKPSRRKIYEYLRSFHLNPGRVSLHKVVLGIETSCDDTAAAVVDETGNVLGEAIHSQTEVHLKLHMAPFAAERNVNQRKDEALNQRRGEFTVVRAVLPPGFVATSRRSCRELWCREHPLQAAWLQSPLRGIIPPVAQQLHRENIQRIVQEALSASQVPPSELSAVATTTMPGLALSLGVGLAFSLQLVGQLKKPFIPIHHMEAHALTIRLTNEVDFPFLVLLISGGHCLLALVRGVSDFLLLGQSLDIAPGDMLDKVARRLSLVRHPECAAMSGGRAIEHLAKRGNRLRFDLTPPMHRAKNCDFSFTGLQHAIDRIVTKKEKEEGLEPGQVLSSAPDIAAAAQHATACHLAKRTHRALLFCQQRGLLPPSNAALVVSGGVASNFYIRKALEIVTDATQCALLCPPPRLCTDNGVMIACNVICLILMQMSSGGGYIQRSCRSRHKSSTIKNGDLSPAGMAQWLGVNL
ncbi:tRNA N6-adenosine threonylcarbamoyltransferase, mitochondrial isoform X2 [Eptesicus fuscus]|uniref:tRNA N6-adenosine threonylcarbamoyltransferase, mitochondrial isoform X2 n=1 Tax=Eptesicus fuscus TaxID=29078 RepID=UPI0024048855|nr:tRNA N6-adenosine threonylcarbamoyltransferase, mitochondrial isoform X2 [Eptesicus fuscus]